jgi:hypothetical protein
MVTRNIAIFSNVALSTLAFVQVGKFYKTAWRHAQYHRNIGLMPSGVTPFSRFQFRIHSASYIQYWWDPWEDRTANDKTTSAGNSTENF